MISLLKQTYVSSIQDLLKCVTKYTMIHDYQLVTSKYTFSIIVIRNREVHFQLLLSVRIKQVHSQFLLSETGKYTFSSCYQKQTSTLSVPVIRNRQVHFQFLLSETGKYTFR